MELNSNETLNLAYVEPRSSSTFVVQKSIISKKESNQATKCWLDINNVTYNIDNLDVSTCEEEEEVSIPRCQASSTFQQTGRTFRRDAPSYMSLKSRKECIDLRLIDASCLLTGSEIADTLSLREYDMYNSDEENQTYVSELPTIVPNEIEPSSSSSSGSSPSTCSTSSLQSSKKKSIPIDYSSVIANNTSIKAPTCRSIYKYLIKRVSKKLGNKKNSVVKSSTMEAEPITNDDSMQSIRVYAHNHKRDSAMPTSSTANTSQATVAYLVHRRSNFYATNDHLREIASPIGMKNFEWNRLNCGEFFSYNV